MTIVMMMTMKMTMAMMLTMMLSSTSPQPPPMVHLRKQDNLQDSLQARQLQPGQYQHQYDRHDLKWFLPGKCQEQVLRFQLLDRRQEPFKVMVNSLTIFSPKIFQDGGE